MENYRVEVFVERQDGNIWPIPGVYAEKTRFNSLNIPFNIHDSLIKLPNHILYSYLQEAYKHRNLVIIVYLGGFFFNDLDVSQKVWLDIINKKMNSMKNLFVNIELFVIGFASRKNNLKSFFSNYISVLENGYDSFNEIIYKISQFSKGLSNNSFRKSVNYISANTYRWNSANLMIDMPSMMCPSGGCLLCPMQPDNCESNINAKKIDLGLSYNGLWNDIVLNAFPKNIRLTGNQLNISDEKIIGTCNILSKIKSEFELHLDFNILKILKNYSVSKLLTNYDIGSLRLSIPAINEISLKLYGFEKIDILEEVKKIRSWIGNKSILCLSITIGLPGDNLKQVDSYVSLLREIANIIQIDTVNINANSNIFKYGFYNTNNIMVDDWGNLDWNLENMNRQEAIYWLEQYEDNLKNDLFHANYKNMDEIFFASDNKLSSVQVNDEISQALKSKNSTERLKDIISRRKILQLQNYLELYSSL